MSGAAVMVRRSHLDRKESDVLIDDAKSLREELLKLAARLDGFAESLELTTQRLRDITPEGNSDD